MRALIKRHTEYVIFRKPSTEEGNLTRWVGGFASLDHAKDVFRRLYQDKRVNGAPEYVLGRIHTDILEE